MPDGNDIEFSVAFMANHHITLLSPPFNIPVGPRAHHDFDSSGWNLSVRQHSLDKIISRSNPGCRSLQWSVVAVAVDGVADYKVLVEATFCKL